MRGPGCQRSNCGTVSGTGAPIALKREPDINPAQPNIHREHIPITASPKTAAELENTADLEPQTAEFTSSAAVFGDAVIGESSVWMFGSAGFISGSRLSASGAPVPDGGSAV